MGWFYFETPCNKPMSKLDISLKEQNIRFSNKKKAQNTRQFLVLIETNVNLLNVYQFNHCIYNI